MSPTSLGAISLATPSIPGPPLVPAWRNPAPEDWKKLDDRKNFIQTSHNLFLEMHPNATRGVKNYTKYCVLNILIMNLTSTISPLGWSSSQQADRGATWNSNSDITPLHIIRSNYTGRYLCMDDRSVVYQSDNFSYANCAFRHEYEFSKYRDRYYKLVNKTVKWYLGMNKDGFMLCGNSTKQNQKGVSFTKSIYSIGTNEPVMTDAAPIKHRNKKMCCKKKGCRTRRPKCRKNWCRSHRQKFFKLSLKELRKYFKHCVKNKIRHCKRGRKVDR